jgi:RHS repeat-associated protein
MTNLPVASGTGGGWTLYWDAENRLTEIANATTRIVNTFDSQHRRVRKQVYTDNTLVTDAAYLYDGWNLVAETISDPQSKHTNFYIWGADRDGSMDSDSGGVGGLLAIIRDTTVYYPVMNHHGDVMALIDDSGSNIVARYEYDPWGVLLSATGPAVDACPFRWQTKYIDAETGLYYFGYRFFDSLTGRWLSRDPLEEDGGVNLYAFCGNDPVNGVDPLGLATDFAVWVAAEEYDTETIASSLCGSQEERAHAEAILAYKGLSPNDILRDAQQRESVRYAALPEFSEFGRLMGGAIKGSAKAASIPVGIVAVAYVGSAAVPYAGVGLEYAGRTAINQGYRGIQYAGQAVIKQWYRVAPLIPPVVEYADDVASRMRLLVQDVYIKGRPLYQSAVIRMNNGIFWYNFSEGKAAMAVRAVTGVLEDRLLQPEATIGGTLTGQPKFQYNCGVFANTVCQGIIQMTQWIYSGERQSDPQNDNAGTWDGIMPIGGITVNGIERVQLMLPDQK